ncbi:HAD family hydrolase [Evansella halocellulosilytica]|uniref:HAD family hydrolase n=1 Tax=Evansella halocellulosilytica TaxID=2011013 RepID=UPI000BB7A5FC|nr:HAD family hydrolase [Evansella halocellulosilytica]
MIKAVLFDLDGTLLDREHSLLHFIKDQYDRLYDDLSHIDKDEYLGRFIELDDNGYVWKDKVYEQLIVELKIKSLTVQNLLNDYISEFKHHCVPFPQLKETLDALKGKGYALGMITNGRGKFQIDNVAALQIKDYFDTILVSEWEKMKKPDPNIFRKALKQLSVLPEESVFVGDHPKKDVEAAQNVGMKAIWVKNDHWGSEKADAVIKNLIDIPQVVEDWRK